MDPELFNQLALPLLDPLYNMAHWLTGNRSDAEDLVQETFAKALKGADRFQPETNFRAWIFRIMRNTFLTSRAGLAVRMTSFLDDEEGVEERLQGGDTPESALLLKLDQEAVRRALAELDISHREVLLLCEVEEMPYREIAETLSIPMGTVMSRISRARRALRQLLSPEMKIETKAETNTETKRRTS
ncbi:MAG: sigma-70 family RNA polymerase sigma factor [Acidobacteriaceae bacterium]